MSDRANTSTYSALRSKTGTQCVVTKGKDELATTNMRRTLVPPSGHLSNAMAVLVNLSLVHKRKTVLIQNIGGPSLANVMLGLPAMVPRWWTPAL